MGDEGINLLIVLLMFFAFMSMRRGRRLGREQRDLQSTIEHLQSTQVAGPALSPGASKEQIERLEDRVRVLERIVTDRGYNLAAEIEALRDPDATLVPVREIERSTP